MSQADALDHVPVFLASAAERPTALVVGGDAGIGKTTMWLSAVKTAREQGFRVLSARASDEESMLAYAAVADLIGDVDSETLDALPDVQRVAVDRMLLRAAADAPITDQRVAAAAFTSIVDMLSVAAPVVVAVDDVQCLDVSSQGVLAYAARRLKGRVGLLLTERTESIG